MIGFWVLWTGSFGPEWSMSLILLVSIAIRIVAFGWAVALLRRTRDWRMGFLALMLALMGLRQVLTLITTRTSTEIVVGPGTTELPGLVVSVMAFLAIFFLERVISGQRRSFRDLQREVGERVKAEEELRRKVAEVEELNRSLRDQKEELSTYHSLITHDVTNFCTTLQAVSDRFLSAVDGALNPTQERLVRRAARQVFELNRLAENARLLTRLRDRGLPAGVEPAPLSGVLSTVMETVKAVHFDRNIRLESAGTEGVVLPGVPFVENVFLNLVDNAVRYTPRRDDPAIRVEASTGAEGLAVAVRGGEPAEDEMLATVTERHTRGPRSTGSGLGLALVREIVERSGGRIEARNVGEGEDRTFEIVLHLPGK